MAGTRGLGQAGRVRTPWRVHVEWARLAESGDCGGYMRSGPGWQSQETVVGTRGVGQAGSQETMAGTSGVGQAQRQTLLRHQSWRNGNQPSALVLHTLSLNPRGIIWKHARISCVEETFIPSSASKSLHLIGSPFLLSPSLLLSTFSLLLPSPSFSFLPSSFLHLHGK